MSIPIMKHTIPLFTAIIIFSFVICFPGCSGAKMTMTATKLDYPVSTTQGIYDPNYKLLSEEDYESLGKFEFGISKWSMFWTLIPLTKDPDVSDKLNSIIKEKGGDAVVNLQIYTGTMQNGAVFVNFFSSVVPLLPGVAFATVSGDVVKVKK